MPLKVVMSGGSWKLLKVGNALSASDECCCDNACRYDFYARIIGGQVYGQVDGGEVVSQWNTNLPSTTDQLSFGVSGPITSVGGSFTVGHTIRLWISAFNPTDVTLNEIGVLNILFDPICANGVTYTTTAILPEVMPIITDPGFPFNDQSGGGAIGIDIVIECGACPEIPAEFEGGGGAAEFEPGGEPVIFEG